MKLKNNSRQKIRGLTLVEVMVTVSIIVLAIFAMCITMAMLMRASQKSVDHSQGYMAASSILRQYIADNRNSMHATTHNGEIMFGYKKYNYDMVVTKSGTLDLYQITVTVKWSQADEKNPDAIKKLEAVVATMARGTSALAPKYPGG